MISEVDEISRTPPLLHCNAVTQQTVELGHYETWRVNFVTSGISPKAEVNGAVIGRLAFEC